MYLGKHKPFSFKVLLFLIFSTLILSTPKTEAAQYQHFGWEEIKPGVWFGKVLPNFFQGGNVSIVALPSGGSMVVDTGNSEVFGQEILTKVKSLGLAPVRYVVNTHLHQDHLGGNMAFKLDNPNVEILAHANTCRDAPTKTISRMHDRLPGIERGLIDLRAQLSALAKDSINATALEHRIQGTELYLLDAHHFNWAMPNVCLDMKPGEIKVIQDQGRRIEIRYFGRGHTAGDLTVYLPQEKLIAIGDLWGFGSGFIASDAGLDGREGSVLETPLTLKSISQLDFDVALTGHAGALIGKSSLQRAIALGEQTIAKVAEANERGVTIGALLQSMPPPEKAPAFVVDGWTSVVVRAFEEIELRRMWGLPLPNGSASP